MAKKIDKSALATVEFDGEDIRFVTVNNLRLPQGIYSQLCKLLDSRYNDLGEAIADGAREIVKQNAGLLLAREMQVGARLVLSAIRD